MTYLIIFIGIYLLGYVEHCRAVDAYMSKVEEEARQEHKHYIEEHIRDLHEEGVVFGEAA